MAKENRDFYSWDAELLDREVFLIGKIIVQWGALEHEIFTQTLLTFDAPKGEAIKLPGAMSNLQFTQILQLWRERVVDHAKGPRAKVLQAQFDEILRLKQFRDALVHGMWNWSPEDLTKISTVRIRKKEIITTAFTADDLEDFCRRVGRVNFKIRFPRGLRDLAQARAKQGFYISRRGLSMFTDHPVTNDWLPLVSDSSTKADK